jgi:N-acetyl-anhydromuramyl-L-alanine amidase AmpD
MNYKQISIHERNFYNNRVDSSGNSFDFLPTTLELPTYDCQLPIVQLKRNDGVQSFFFQEETPKTKIVLHHTGGYLKGDIAQLTQADYHVSTAFVIAREGTVYQLFDPRYWSYHLGKEAVGGNSIGSRSSVAIELSNIGELIPRGEHMVAASNPTRVYCSVADTSQYVTLPTPYRGYQHFATFTDDQYTRLAQLIDYLTTAFGIQNNMLPPAFRFDTLTQEQVADYQGILSHVNFREKGKTDLSPAFDYDRLAALTGSTIVEPNYSLQKTTII